MTALSIILLIVFVLISLLLVFVIAIQSEDNTGLGGVFGGSSDSAFGGQTNKVINKITAWLVGVFILLALIVAVVNKSTNNSILSTAAQQNAVAEASQEASN